MRTFAALLLAGLLTACGGSDPGLPVYLLLGQSNMVGYGETVKTALLPEELRQAGPAEVFFDGQWQPLAPGVGYQNEGSDFGPEISFAKAMGHVGIVKVARGGTSLAVDWAPGSVLREKAIAQAAAALASRHSYLAGVLWVQGEADMFNAEHAAAYKANLQAFVADLRSRLGSPQAPFLGAKLNAPLWPSMPYRDQVRSVQVDPGIPLYGYIDADQLTIGADEIHYDGPGLVKMGELFALLAKYGQLTGQ